MLRNIRGASRRLCVRQTMTVTTPPLTKLKTHPHHLTARYLTTQSAQISQPKPTTTDWSATQYLKFNDQRSLPVRDLISKIPLSTPTHIIDLGCGPGNSTALLRASYSNASKIIGMDSSPDMIRKAKESLPDLEFTLADLTTYQPDKSADLLFSNAVFQWLPADQRIPIMKRLLQNLKSNGVLAIQIPDNFNEPSHAGMREIAKHWHDTIPPIQSAALPQFPTPELLHDELSPLCSDLNIWHTSYYHVLPDHAAIVEWVKGTGLRPFLDLLGKEHEQEFLRRYLGFLGREYQSLEDGGVMLRYPRLFVVAVRR